MIWVDITVDQVLTNMATDVRIVYDQWVANYPEKANRLAIITANTIREFRDGLRSGKSAVLDPRETYLPQSAVRHCYTIIYFELNMEMGVNMTGAATGAKTSADVYLRQLPFDRTLVTTEATTSLPSPKFVVPARRESYGRSLFLASLALLFTLTACSTPDKENTPFRSWINPANPGTSLNVGNVSVTNNITTVITNVNNINGLVVSNYFAPTNIINNTNYVSTIFSPSNTVNVMASFTGLTVNTFSPTNIFSPSNSVIVSASFTGLTLNTFSPSNVVSVSASFTSLTINTFSPSNQVNVSASFTGLTVNSFSQTNLITLGSTTVINTNIFSTSVSNNIDVSVAGVVVTNVFSPTNIITLNNPTAFHTATHTNTPTSVRFWGGTNLATSVVAGANMDIYLAGGSGSGNITIEGVTTNVFDFVGQFPVTVSNVGNTIYWGLASGSGIFIPSVGSNQVITYASATSQFFTVPAGTTQLYAYAWGAAGGGGSGGGTTYRGGAGGYAFGYFSVTNGEVLELRIGQGGQTLGSTVTGLFQTTIAAYPNGSVGVGRSVTGSGPSREFGGGGGGSTAIYRGTNVLLVAGAGGGSVAASTGGANGGGITGGTGYNESNGISGGGGTQTNGGSTGSTTVPLAWTNRAGSFMQGGDAGMTTNQLAGAAGGGGGGYFGGGGALTATANNSRSGGGGGSGFINTSQGVLGVTIRAPLEAFGGASPPSQDDPLYVSGVGVGNAGAAGGNGLLILRW